MERAQHGRINDTIDSDAIRCRVETTSLASLFAGGPQVYPGPSRQKLLARLPGVSWSRTYGLCRVHGPRKLGNRPGWWCSVWVPVNLCYSDLQLPGHCVAISGAETGDCH